MRELWERIFGVSDNSWPSFVEERIKQLQDKVAEQELVINELKSWVAKAGK